jgi:argininosuccinate lyase
MRRRNPTAKASDIWGGRFNAGPSDCDAGHQRVVDVDKRLFEQDIDGSLAHARMLSACGVISSADAAGDLDGLEAMRADIRGDRFEWKPELEDVHMNIEAALRERIGAAAGRLHTARSRNDQVATDFRLWLRERA